MPNKKLSPDRLKARIQTLSRRHRDLDAQVEAEQTRPLPDMTKLRTLKQEKLGLKDAIRVTRLMLARASAQHSRLA